MPVPFLPTPSVFRSRGRMFSAGHVTCSKFVHISFTAACAALVKVTSVSLAPAQGCEGKVTETLQPAREVARSDVPSALPYRPNPGLVTLQTGAASLRRPISLTLPTESKPGHLTDRGSAGACSNLRPVALPCQPYCPAALQSQLTDH